MSDPKTYLNSEDYAKRFEEAQMKRFVARALMDDRALDDKWIQILFIECLYELADNYDKNALIVIGNLHETGFKSWFPQNINKAICYYVKAIKAGILFGYECIGGIYFHIGKDDADYRKAYYCLTAVLTHGGSLTFGGNYMLGEMYRKGLFVEKNIEKAKRYYEKVVTSDMEYRELDEYYSLAKKQYKKLCRN